jgi:ribose transport system substrate-binding protein
MKTLKKFVWPLLLSGFVFEFGCDSHKNQDVYYMIAANVSLPYWQAAASGFNRAATQYKVSAKVAGPNSYDPIGELDALQQAVRAKPAGILISVSDVSILQREIDAAIAEGIPVITMDSDAITSRRLYFIGTNNVEAGHLGGDRLVDKLNGKGNVVFFTLPGQPNTEERLKGFKDVLRNQPGIKIVDIVDVKGGAQVALQRAQDLLKQTGPKKVDAFVCLEATSGKPVSDAIKQTGARDRVVIAWDADQGTLDGVNDGTIEATIAQKPYTMGYFGFRMLYDVSQTPPPQLSKDFKADFFSPYPVFVDTGSTLVDRSNVDLYRSAASLNK